MGSRMEVGRGKFFVIFLFGAFLFGANIIGGTGIAKAAPVNDQKSNAILVFLDTPYAGTTVSATGIDESSCALNDKRDVWYRFYTPDSGEFGFSLCGSFFDTTLTIFTGFLGPEIACNDDDCGLQSQVKVNLIAGRVYFIRIAGYNGAISGIYAKIGV